MTQSEGLPGYEEGKKSQLDYRKKKRARARERERESTECRGDEWLNNSSRTWILRFGLSLTLWPSYQAFPELFWQLFHMLPVNFHPNTGQCHVSIISGELSLCECVCDGSYHWSCYTWTSLSLCLSLQVVDTDAGFPACLGAVMKYWFPLQYVAVVRAMCWMWLHCTSLCLWEKGKKNTGVYGWVWQCDYRCNPTMHFPAGVRDLSLRTKY